MPVENLIGQWRGGIASQRHHLNAMVDAINGHENRLDLMEAKGGENLLDVMVLSPDGRNLNRIQIQNAHLVADMGKFYNEPFPFMSIITGGTLASTGPNDPPEFDTVDFQINPRSSLMYDVPWDCQFGITGLNVPPFEPTTLSLKADHAAWVEMKFKDIGGQYLIYSAELKGGEKWAQYPTAWVEDDVGHTWYQLLITLEKPEPTEPPDMVFTGDDKRKVINHTTTHLRTIKPSTGSFGPSQMYPPVVDWAAGFMYPSTLSSGTMNWNYGTGTQFGTLTINGGTITSGQNGLTNSFNNAIILNGSFTFSGSNSLNLGTGNVTLSQNITATISSASLTFGGVISGSNGINKAGVGTLIFGGNNTYSGTTTVSAGTLQIGI